jgi:hypothetical protein
MAGCGRHSWRFAQCVNGVTVEVHICVCVKGVTVEVQRCVCVNGVTVSGCIEMRVHVLCLHVDSDVVADLLVTSAHGVRCLTPDQPVDGRCATHLARCITPQSASLTQSWVHDLQDKAVVLQVPEHTGDGVNCARYR